MLCGDVNVISSTAGTLKLKTEGDRKDNIEAETKHKLWGEVKQFILRGSASYCYKVPRQCPLVLLISQKFIHIIFKGSVLPAKKHVICPLQRSVG
jgi:hypothetical protein